MLPFEEIEKKVGSRYALTVLAGKRARDLREGSPQLVNSDSSNPILVALQEILEGKIVPANLDYTEAAATPEADAAEVALTDEDLAALTDADAAGVELPGAADITGAPVSDTAVEDAAVTADAPAAEDAAAAVEES